MRVGNFFGGLPIKQQRDSLKDKDKCPHVIVGTPGRVKGVSRGASGRVEGQGAGQGAAAASGVGGGGGGLSSQRLPAVDLFVSWRWRSPPARTRAGPFSWPEPPA